MDQFHTANKVCGGCCAISLNTVDTESSVSPKISVYYMGKFSQSLFRSHAVVEAGLRESLRHKNSAVYWHGIGSCDA